MEKIKNIVYDHFIATVKSSLLQAKWLYSSFKYYVGGGEYYI